MGRILSEMAESQGSEVAARVDVSFTAPELSRLDEYTGPADCVIDFSNHSATSELLAYCTGRNLPVLIASTGQNEDELDEINRAAKRIPVFKSPNMSIGVALVAELAQKVAKLFGECDVELIEAHHNQKLDVPSGTALMLAEEIIDARGGTGFMNIGRHEDGRRSASEIGIHSLRYGSEVGSHEIIFSNGLETITIRHDAKNRALFANGALQAARWLVNQSAGLYNMKDFIAGKSR